MPNYRRAIIPGGTWFFTVNLLQRHHNDLLVREIDLLRETVRRVREKHPFQIDAWVVLPEHLHSTAWMQEVGRKLLLRFLHSPHPCGLATQEQLPSVWTLPPGDSNFSLRWRLIKGGFSRALPKTERRSAVRKASGEHGIWQRHYWEHFIRDDADYQRHVDYVHVNPLKHGHVNRVVDWPYSTFHRYVEKGIYPSNWCGDIDSVVGGDE